MRVFVRVYCLTNLICSFSSLSLFLLCCSPSASSLSSYYFSITFPIRLIAQGCVFFWSPVRECSFLVNRVSSSKEKKSKQRKSEEEFHMFSVVFFSFVFFLLLLSVLSSPSSLFFGYMIVYSLCFILVWYTSRLIKQNRFSSFLDSNTRGKDKRTSFVCSIR